MEKKEKIAIATGCSGGHITPALTLVQQQYPHHDIVFFAKNQQLDKTILKDKNIFHSYFLSLINIPWNSPFRFPLFMVQFCVAFVKSFYTLIKLKPVKLISSGSYIALPVSLAARLLSIPIELYEVNVVPGQALKLVGKIATKIYCCFESTQKFFPKHKTSLLPYPVRFTPADIIDDKKKLYQHHGFDPAKKTLFILGGSQGSTFLNKCILSLVKSNPVNSWQIIHQTGNDSSTNWKEFYKSHLIPAVVFSYTDTISDFFNLADLVITRAGAGILAEIGFFKKRCIVIPLTTSTTEHQLQNAQAYAQNFPSLFTIINQDQITSQLLSSNMKAIESLN